MGVWGTPTAPRHKCLCLPTGWEFQGLCLLPAAGSKAPASAAEPASCWGHFVFLRNTGTIKRDRNAHVSVSTAWAWLSKNWNMMKKGVGKGEIANITGDSQSFTCPAACWGVRKVVYVPTLPLTISCLY